MPKEKSPVIPPQEASMAPFVPTCPNCKTPVEKIKYMDYGDIRVVFHDAEHACVLGVMKA